MSDQLELSYGSRLSDPETSQAAASRNPLLRKSDRERALIILKAHPEGLTDHELGALMGRQQTSAGKRRGELCTLQLVEWAGFRRAAPSGSSARVWRCVK